MADREVLATHCCLCGKSARKKLRWFSVNSKNYYCIAICPVHGYIKGCLLYTSKQLAGEVKQKYASEEKYEYAEPLLDIPRDQSFQFTIGFDPGEKGMTSFGEIIKICEESDLTHTLPYMASWDEGSENTFTIRPPRNGGLQVLSLIHI